jgi:hypothetical protein
LLQDDGIMEPFPIGRDDLREVIAAKLRDGPPLDAEGVRDALIAHLGTRLDVMPGNLAELPAEARKPQELADMRRHLRRWEQGLPDEPAANADIAPFDMLGSFARWRMETAGPSAIADSPNSSTASARAKTRSSPLRRRFKTSLMRSPRPSGWPPTSRAARDALAPSSDT